MIFTGVDLSIRKKQGNVGVAKAIYEYTKLGYTVLVPFTDSDKYDLVVDNGEQLLKVQVKTSRCKNKPKKREKSRTGYQVNLATKGGNTKRNVVHHRQKEDYDLLFVLIETGACWSIPVEALGDAKTAICVGATGPNAKYGEYELK